MKLKKQSNIETLGERTSVENHEWQTIEHMKKRNGHEMANLCKA